MIQFEAPASSCGPQREGHHRGPMGVSWPAAGCCWAWATWAPPRTPTPAATLAAAPVSPVCRNPRRETPASPVSGVVPDVPLNCSSHPDCMAASPPRSADRVLARPPTAYRDDPRLGRLHGSSAGVRENPPNGGTPSSGRERAAADAADVATLTLRAAFG